MTTTLTPERIAALRAQNAAREPTDWPARYLVDELLDVIEAQQAEIERLRGMLHRIHEQKKQAVRDRRAALRGEASDA